MIIVVDGSAEAPSKKVLGTVTFVASNDTELKEEPSLPNGENIELKPIFSVTFSFLLASSSQKVVSSVQRFRI